MREEPPHAPDRDLSMAQALSEIEARFFVGRTAEVQSFETWLNARRPEPGLFHVWGPGGSGKTALLRAFARIADAAGRRVLRIDGREIRADPAALAAALGAADLDAAVAALNAQRAVLMIDTFELLVDLTRVFLSEIIPKLNTGVRLVIAGRHSLGLAWEPWRPLLREVRLGGLSDDEVRTYLATRGLTDRRLADQLLRVAGGLPLAVSLVTDLVLQLGARDLGSATEWHRVVRSLVEHLLADVPEPVERELLEAGAVVRQFDESILAEITEHQDISRAFTAICRLSIVQVGRHGLLLHDDVRHILANDLRWRQPERYATLRLRALAAYRRRMRRASLAEREWLLSERLAFWENAFVQAMLFTDAEVGRVWLDWARPEDTADLERIWFEWLDTWLSTQMTLQYDPQVEHDMVQGILQLPATRTRVARDSDGRAVGFSTALPIARETLAEAKRHPGVRPAVEALVARAGAQMSETAAESNTYFFLNLAHSASDPIATQQALIRDVFGLFARGGKYIVCTPVPVFKTLFEALGFERLAKSESAYWSDNDLGEGFFLDLTRMGVERWIEAIVAGEVPPRPIPPDDILRALQQEILPNWHNDGPVGDSSLAKYFGPHEDDRARRAAATRTIITETLERLHAQRKAEHAAALRAIEAAYITRSGTHERLADELGVSRATWYRLLRRGARELATALETLPLEDETS